MTRKENIMSLLENSNGNLSAADVAAVVGNNRGYNNGGFLGGDGSGLFWIIILFLFAMFGNGFGGNNNGGNAQPVIVAGPGFGGGGCSSVQQVIDQQSVMNGISGLNSTLNQGFANAEISRCNSQANVLQQMNNNQNATTSALYGISSSLQNCCCENRAATADLKYTIATENCADRNLVQQNTRDIIEVVNNKNQVIMDKLCQLEMDNMRQNYEAQLRAKDQQISTLQNQAQLNAINTGLTAQTAQLMADNTAQTVALENYLDPPVRPAYIVPNPNGCTPTYYQGSCCGRRVA